MSSDNIEKFNEITGKVFALLYGSFPIPQDLFPHSIDIAPTPQPEYDPETATLGGIGIASTYELNEEEKLFGHTVAWLVDTGYLSAKRRNAVDMYQGVVLTAKGLEVLKAVPSALDKNGSKSYGEQLQEAAKTGISETLKGLANETLTKGVGLVIQTVSSSFTS